MNMNPVKVWVDKVIPLGDVSVLLLKMFKLGISIVPVNKKEEADLVVEEYPKSAPSLVADYQLCVWFWFGDRNEDPPTPAIDRYFVAVSGTGLIGINRFLSLFESLPTRKEVCLRGGNCGDCRWTEVV